MQHQRGSANVPPNATVPSAGALILPVSWSRLLPAAGATLVRKELSMFCSKSSFIFWNRPPRSCSWLKPALRLKFPNISLEHCAHKASTTEATSGLTALFTCHVTATLGQNQYKEFRRYYLKVGLARGQNPNLARCLRPCKRV